MHQNRRLRGVMTGGVVKRFPHVHHCQTDLFGLLFPDKPIELVHAGLGPILAAEPDRAMTDEVADDNAVGVSLANRDLVDADALRSRRTGTLELRAHVLLRSEEHTSELQSLRH